MLAVLQGFLLLGILVGLGYVLGRTKVLGEGADTVLSRLAFFVATPALLFTTLRDAELAAVFSTTALVSVVAPAILAVVYLIVVRGLLKRPGPESLIGALTASYVNAGNLGIPILVFATGSATAVAPVLLFQLLVMAPVTFTYLDVATGRRGGSRLHVISTPFRNPIVLAVLAAVALVAFEVDLPLVVSMPIDMLSDVAVPGMLLAFGISLHGSPVPGRGGLGAPLWVGVGLKCLGGPALAVGLGLALGLRGSELLPCVITASLPTAQNVFIYAMRYGRSVPLAREAVLLTTMLCIPVILIASAVLG